jgi:molecular chaperone DnaK (HSP70)
MKGVDFGTSTSFMAESTALRTAVIPLGDSEPWVPSVIGVSGSDLLPGERGFSLSEDQLIRSIKSAITAETEYVYQFNGKDVVEIQVDTLIEVFLAEIRSRATDQFLKLQDLNDVRLGCPAMWTGPQRQRLIDLASRAGIGAADHTVIDEPVAAGIAWVSRRIEENQSIEGKVLIFDMGGGTLDVAVLQVVAEPRGPLSISVLSAVGVDQAGDSLDQNLSLYLAEKIRRVHSIDVDEAATGWVRRGAAEAKIDLSFQEEVAADFHNPGQPLPSVRLTRSELDEVFAPQLNSAIKEVWHALRASLMTQVKSNTHQATLSVSQTRQIGEADLATDVDYVVLVGGMSMMPVVQERISEIFPHASIWLGDERTGNLRPTNPNQLVARGLAYDSEYHRISLHRPGFDFYLTWVDDSQTRREIPIYNAYSPLYDTFTAQTFNSAKYRWAPNTSQIPAKGSGYIKVRTLAGNEIRVRERDLLRDGIPYSFGTNTNQVLTIEPSGRIFVRDGAGNEAETRVSQWPVIRAGEGLAELIVETPPTDSMMTKLVWHELPYD